MDEAKIDNPAAGEGRGAHENHGEREGQLAAHLRPLVVKIGSSTLTTSESKIDYAFLDDVARQVTRVREAGFSPIIVTSAAIACGLEALGIERRPTDMPSLQAAASLGQSALSAGYARAFAQHGITTSLVLLTRRDTADRTAYLHARDTLSRLLEMGVVPIVNENDTVSVEQIRFGDNDTLAALVACLVEAELMVVLSDIDGLYDANPTKVKGAHLIERVERIDEGDAGSVVGSGGMITKIKAARVLMAAGIPMTICLGHAPDAIVHAAFGERIGTRFAASERPHEITPRKLWIALGDSARGALIVDDGAKNALLHRGSSLLSVGISRVEGRFNDDDIVDVKDATGHVIARGRTAFSSDEVELACGRTREELERNRLLAAFADKPVIHRDELIAFE